MVKYANRYAFMRALHLKTRTCDILLEDRAATGCRLDMCRNLHEIQYRARLQLRRLVNFNSVKEVMNHD